MLVGREILLIEDNDRLAALYETHLSDEEAVVHRTSNGMTGLAMANKLIPSVILLDIQLPDIDGFEVLRRLKRAGNLCPVVVITSHGSVNWAVEAMRLGAYDFLVKPFDGQRLLVTVKNAIEHHELEEIVQSVTRPIPDEFHDFVGNSSPMQTVYRTIVAAAASKASVFITGESGTGKELCAHAIHEESPRRREPFIPLNCGAIPRELMEAEIFGHRKGAFTGAIMDRIGAAELANGGTLFLDEIGEMDKDLQTKLLRFIQTGTYTRIGESTERQGNVRFVCATNREPIQAIQDGHLREDLFYRLNVIPIRMPPLRDRIEDIEPISMRFLGHFSEEESKRFKRFDADALKMMQDYIWPGNVRELQNVVRNVVVLNEGDVVTGPMISAALNPGFAKRPYSYGRLVASAEQDNDFPGKQPDGAIRPLSLVERDAIEAAIDQCDGNIPQAASALGVAPSTLYRKIQSWRDAS
ncbi:MAG: sigma-54 dependent transcriptional regulator [Alphaproteobacteria bacterium]|nr:sigma-54 dependent transcriptional regulator [Alphaproteobacteria bacterium]